MKVKLRAHLKQWALPCSVDATDWPRVAVSLLCIAFVFTAGRSQAVREVVENADSPQLPSGPPYPPVQADHPDDLFDDDDYDEEENIYEAEEEASQTS